MSENVPVIARATKWSLTVVNLCCVASLIFNERELKRAHRSRLFAPAVCAAHCLARPQVSPV